jgi:hypothetical protein
VLTTDVLGKKSFARPMHKHDNGVYVKIRFELDPSRSKPWWTGTTVRRGLPRPDSGVDERRESILVKGGRDEGREAARAAAAEKEAAESQKNASAPEA